VPTDVGPNASLKRRWGICLLYGFGKKLNAGLGFPGANTHFPENTGKVRL
jgi:hypothetical protein